jgi:hypothetical protein
MSEEPKKVEEPEADTKSKEALRPWTKSAVEPAIFIL